MKQGVHLPDDDERYLVLQHHQVMLEAGHMTCLGCWAASGVASACFFRCLIAIGDAEKAEQCDELEGVEQKHLAEGVPSHGDVAVVAAPGLRLHGRDGLDVFRHRPPTAGQGHVRWLARLAAPHVFRGRVGVAAVVWSEGHERRLVRALVGGEE